MSELSELQKSSLLETSEFSRADQSINQDISNAPANKISRWRARQTMDVIKQKTKCE